ncbi:transaldolase [Helicobacter fennelliae]|uniref:Transaldolase n=1 Tax=Helicobacter fennelliae TaxID=215 RepID=A0A2X3BDK0_9HELI|nr:transaldolase [Helicobacter fennelliae]SQB98941.1 transaldolase [Helicobacter fennelliae]
MKGKIIKDFSLWCDFIERGFLQKDFDRLISEQKFNGATSNPSIFAQAILHSASYQDEIQALKAKQYNSKQIYETLAIKDIQLVASKLNAFYIANQDSGYISIEIDPRLCDDVKASIAEGRRLYEEIGFENVMIKVPATQAGFEVMKELYASGIHINATLVFSPAQAKECARILNDSAKTSARAVISVFVSRFDTLDMTNAINTTDATNATLENPNVCAYPRLGILNAMVCYSEIEAFNNPNIRTLFASTGAKSPHIPKDFYITNLIAPHTINTAPLATIEAFWQNPSQRVIQWLDKKRALDEIAHINLGGKSLDSIYDMLLQNGLSAFKSSFQELLASLS